MKKINREIVSMMLQEMPENKKEVLRKALYRNEILTSSRVMSSATLTVYIEGFLLKLEGTRCSFTVFARDNDGELVFTRKPNEKNLRKLYEDWDMMNESDFDNI